jgi:hypothetical protein
MEPIPMSIMLFDFCIRDVSIRFFLFLFAITLPKSNRDGNLLNRMWADPFALKPFHGVRRSIHRILVKKLSANVDDICEEMSPRYVAFGHACEVKPFTDFLDLLKRPQRQHLPQDSISAAVVNNFHLQLCSAHLGLGMVVCAFF